MQFQPASHLSRKAIATTILGIIAACLTLGYQQIGLAQSPPDQGTSPPDFFVEAEVDNLSPYLGQQITYNLKRYQATEFPGRPYYEDRTYDGFWNIPLIQRPSFTTTIAGREYLVHPTHIALFATIPGPNTLVPTTLVIRGETPEFDIRIDSEAISLNIRSLPDGAPSDFQGAVGQFEIRAFFAEEQGQAEQPINLIVEVSGNGNIETLPPPNLSIPAPWRKFIFPIGVDQVQSEVPLSKEVVKGVRRFETLIVPTQPGEQLIPNIRYSFFDPQIESYRVIRTEPITINILPNPDSASTFASPVAADRQEIRRLGGDIRHIKPAPPVMANRTISSTIIELSAFWSCIILPPLVVVGTWFGQIWRRRQLANDPQTRRQRARNRARKMLATAQGIDPYGQVKLALTSYLSDILNRPVTGLTSNQLFQLLREMQLPPDLVERVHSLLDRVETSQFAPVAGEQSTTRALIAGARVLIDDLENFFKSRNL